MNATGSVLLDTTIVVDHLGSKNSSIAATIQTNRNSLSACLCFSCVSLRPRGLCGEGFWLRLRRAAFQGFDFSFFPANIHEKSRAQLPTNLAYKLLATPVSVVPLIMARPSGNSVIS